MALTKKYWFEEGLYPTEDYDFGDAEDDPMPEFNFDFGDTDEQAPFVGDDDGLYNFGYIGTDYDDPCTAEGDYNFGELFDIDSFNFRDLLEDPPVEGPDDGEFNFGCLDTEEDDPATAIGNYDFGDLDDGDTASELVIDISTMDFYDTNSEDQLIDEEEDIRDDESEEEDDHAYDYNDIDEHPSIGRKHTPFDREHDFGKMETIGWYYTQTFLLNATNEAIIEMMGDESYYAEIINNITKNDSYIKFQYFYNERTNKSFIQFVMMKNDTYDRIELVERIVRKIKESFYLETGITPEIMNNNQQSNVCDNKKKLTPYSIGYWKSLDGKYEILDDTSQIALDFAKNSDNIFEEFKERVYELDLEYNLFDNNKKLSQLDKKNYMAEYYDIVKNYKGTIAYVNKMKELNLKYNSNAYINSNIPEAFSKYMQLYKEYFNTNLIWSQYFVYGMNVAIRCTEEAIA